MLKNKKAFRFIGVFIFVVSLPFSVIANDNDANQLDAIIVDASKHAVVLDRLDNSVIIKSAEELEAANVTQVQDLEKVFPGLVMRTRGNRTFASGTIRGVSSPDFYSPAIQIYVDGIPQDNSFLTQELMNVESVELLRGPQGTLYGGNAQGGIINIITKKAEQGGKISLLAADQESGATLTASTKMGDNFYGDFSFRNYKEEGHIKYTPTRGSDVDDAQTDAGQIRLHYLPDNSPLAVTFTAGSDSLESREEFYLTQAQFDARTATSGLPLLERDVKTYALSIDYDFGDTTLTSISSMQDREINRDFFGGFLNNEDQEAFNQEFRLASAYANGASSVIGVNFKDADFNRISNNNFASNSSITDLNNKSQALFGEVLLPLSSATDLTLGFRASREESDINFNGKTSGIASFSGSDAENLFSPKAALGWNVGQSSRIYISYTRGYRPGGFNRAVAATTDSKAFDAEKSDNFELGWRCQCADGRLLIDAALYKVDIEDIQLYVGNVGSQSIQNLGEAESEGLEFSMSYQGSNNIDFNLGGTFGESRFTNSVDTVTNTTYTGNHLPYAPDETVVAGVSYTLPQVGKGNLIFSVNSNYYADTFFNETNTLSQDSYSLVDASISYQIDDFNLKFYAKNIEDKEYRTYSFQQGANVLSNYGDGRIVGVNLSLGF